MKRLLAIVFFALSAHAQFDYDAARPLAVKVVATSARGSIRIEELTYASPHGGDVPALLVVPNNGRKNAGLVFAHWGLGDRHTFLEEAIDLASLGAVSILIDAANTRPGGKTEDAQYPEALAQTVVDLRRAVDLLTARGDVDARRIGFVGLSMGSHVGGILSGIERRISAFVLAGGTARLSEIWGIASLAPLDAKQFVRNAAPARLFLQYAIDDEYVPPAEGVAYYAAASEPKLMKWYDGGHEVDGRARIDRAEWLRDALGIDDRSPAADERIANGELSLVLDIPGMQHVPVRRETTFDVYYPPGMTPEQTTPAVFILGGARGSRARVSAARLVAARAQRAAIVFDGAIESVVAEVKQRAGELRLNANRSAVWSRGGAVPAGFVAYAAFNPEGTLPDGPSLIVTSGGAKPQRSDLHLETSQRAFDVLDDTEASRAALRRTLAFLRAQLPLLSDEEQIRKGIATYTAAVNAQTPEGATVVFAPDILTSFPGTPDADYATLVEAYRQRAPGTVTTRPDIEEILVSGDLAVARIVWNTTVVQDGKTTTRQMKDLQVWRRQADGRWLFSRGIHFRIPPAAP